MDGQRVGVGQIISSCQHQHTAMTSNHPASTALSVCAIAKRWHCVHTQFPSGFHKVLKMGRVSVVVDCSSLIHKWSKASTHPTSPTLSVYTTAKHWHCVYTQHEGRLSKSDEEVAMIYSCSLSAHTPLPQHPPSTAFSVYTTAKHWHCVHAQVLCQICCCWGWVQYRWLCGLLVLWQRCWKWVQYQ